MKLVLSSGSHYNYYFTSHPHTTVTLSLYFTLLFPSPKLCCYRLAGLVFAAENCLLQLFFGEAHRSVPFEATAIVAQVRHRALTGLLLNSI